VSRTVTCTGSNHADTSLIHILALNRIDGLSSVWQLILFVSDVILAFMLNLFCRWAVQLGGLLGARKPTSHAQRQGDG